MSIGLGHEGLGQQGCKVFAAYFDAISFGLGDNFIKDVNGRFDGGEFCLVLVVQVGVAGCGLGDLLGGENALLAIYGHFIADGVLGGDFSFGIWRDGGLDFVSAGVASGG